MRKSFLSFALIAGLFLPIGASQAQDTNTVTATCKDGTAFTGTKGPAPAGVMAASNRGVPPRLQPAPAPRLPRPRHRRARAPLRAPAEAPVRFGSILRARCITAPALAGTARPNKAAICRRRRQRHRAPARTTGRPAARRSMGLKRPPNCQCR